MVGYALQVLGSSIGNFIHTNREEACKEAERLCRKTGKQVTIWIPLATCEPEEMPVKWTHVLEIGEEEG